MNRSTFILVTLITVMLSIASQPVWAQDEEDEPEPWRISGYVFGDAYWVAQNHRDDLENRNGLWFRRMYLTFDRDLGDSLTTRIRFEANSPGDFKGSAKLDAFFKDLYIRWRKNGHDVYLGLSPTPTWNRLEGIWGYRSVVKTPLDLYKFGSSRDTGVAVRGALGSEGKVRYHTMLANGSGTKGETNAGKKMMGSLAFYPTDSFLFEVYTDFEGRPADTNRSTYQAFAAFTGDWGRVGFQAVRQRRDQGAEETLDLDLASVFGVFKAREKLHILLRYDRLFDPNPDGAKISYIPFDPTAKSHFVLVGADFAINGSLNLIPNVELVYYDEPDGTTRPDHDVIPRLTFFWRF